MLRGLSWSLPSRPEPRGRKCVAGNCKANLLHNARWRKHSTCGPVRLFALRCFYLSVEHPGVNVTFCRQTLKSASVKSLDGRLRLWLKPCQGLHTADGWGPEAGWRSEVPCSSGPGSISRLLVQYSIQYSPQGPRWQWRYEAQREFSWTQACIHILITFYLDRMTVGKKRLINSLIRRHLL